VVQSRLRRVSEDSVPGGTAAPGKLLTMALAGAWREPPPPLRFSPQALARVMPRLLETGAAGLAWRRIRQTKLASSDPAFQLQQAYRFQVLQAVLQEGDLQQLLLFLRSAGIQPLLAKGWATARLYPEAGLRPYGDIDLYVRPEDYPAAQTALRSAGAPQCPVDLHRGFPDLPNNSWADLWSRSRVICFREVEVRILGSEDQLRHLCLHLLRHGAWRPLWLCDIGAALEHLPEGFDWSYCLGANWRQSQAVVCALGLAHRLLGACLDEPLVARRARRLPSWLVPALLRQWSLPYRRYQGLPLAAQLRQPAGMMQALRQRWPNPIEATVSMGAAFDGRPRLPYQLGDCLMRLGRFISRPRGLEQELP
jgi:hypothetical protein